MKSKLLLCCLIVLPMACSKDKQSEPKVEKFALEYSIQEREDAYAKMYPYLKVVNKRYTLDLTEEQADTLGVPVALYREALADVEAVNQSFDKAEEEGIPFEVKKLPLLSDSLMKASRKAKMEFEQLLKGGE